MKKYLSRRYLDKVLSELYDIAGVPPSVVPHSRIQEIISDPKKAQAINALDDIGEVKCNRAYGGSVYDLNLTSAGRLRFLYRHEKRVSFWRGAASGIITGVISTLAAQFIAGII